jgi:hypothetical protein
MNLLVMKLVVLLTDIPPVSDPEHFVMIIWLLMLVIGIGGAILGFFLKATYDSNNEWKKEIMNLIELFRDEIRCVSKESKEGDANLDARLARVETRQEDCSTCPGN